MKATLTRLFSHAVLTREEAFQWFLNVSRYPPAQIAAFLAVYQMRPVTVPELTGFRDAMRELCIRVDLSEFNSIDVCGTGGDGKNTFNISTAAAFVVAGADVRVAKHGNVAVSSICGSSNVLEALGVRFANDRDALLRALERAGICYLHAPLFHPAMKHVAPVRRELGVRTFFNILGPLANPCSPAAQLIGVHSLELARLYAYMHQSEAQSFVIVHSLDGYDEVSLTASFKYITRTGERFARPSDLGLPAVMPSDLAGGQDAAESAELLVKILSGNGSPAQRSVVVANAALAIHAAKPAVSLRDCVSEADESLSSGRAYRALNVLREMGA